MSVVGGTAVYPGSSCWAMHCSRGSGQFRRGKPAINSDVEGAAQARLAQPPLHVHQRPQVRAIRHA
eukprot:2946989-Rhodomonas_salina.1